MSTASSSAFARVVPPVTGRLESVLFVLVALVLVAGTLGYLTLRTQNIGPPPLLSWQVNSFDGLSTVDQAIHSALLPAADEIVWANNDYGTWLTIPELEENTLPPFYRDNLWKTSGEVQWQAIMPGATSTVETAPPPPVETNKGLDPFDAPNKVYQGTLGQGTATYYGSGGKAPGQSAYLVVIGHVHSGAYWINQAKIWVHKNPNAPFPGVLKSEALVKDGWRQVIPYNGASEFERVKGSPSG